MPAFAKLCLPAAAALALACAAQAADPAIATPTATKPAAQDTSRAMHHDMMTGMQEMHGMKATGDADKDFAHMMQHHHEQAVKITQTYLKGAKDPQLKAWAQKTLQSQQKELDELKKIQGSMGVSKAGT